MRFSWLFEQQVVHLPELALGGRGFGGLGGQLGGRVHVGQRQVAPHEPKVGVGEQVTRHRFGLAAVRALEVAELDDGDRGVERPADVVAFGVDLGDQVLDQAEVALQRPSPSLRGQQPGEPVDEPGQHCGDNRRGQRTELRLGELGAGECAVGDQQRHGEADTGDGSAAQDGRPADRWPDPSVAQPRHHGDVSTSATGLPTHIADAATPSVIGFV